ncbi:MAG TPA: hypothetical protein VF784_14195 [Anaerolineales bacterium]
MKSRIFVILTSTLALAIFAFGASPIAARADNPLPLPETHLHFNGVEGVIGQDGSTPSTTPRSASGPICSTTSSSAANVNTDCEGTGPHNETSIAVNPTNTQNRIGSANDYQLTLSSGGTIFETVYSRAHVTFDGGATWTSYPVQFNNYTSTGDPAVAFDADGTAYLATLGFLWSQNRFCCVNPDVVVSHSSDGGKTWSKPTRVVSGSGTFGSVGLFNDKEYVTAWGHGNAIVTWTEFNDGIRGSYISSPIFDSVTHDGGNTWSTPTEISGSAPFCIGAQGGNDCNQAQFSVPTVAADGSIYVAFETTANMTTGRDEYVVVKVDPTTGQRVAGPFKVADLFDGFTDYPLNIDGRQTYHDSEFRSNSSGNITADPTHANHLAVIWSDMRNSNLPAPSDPYQAKTNSDVVVSQSMDGGATWSAPTSLTAPGDQFQPWGAYDASGLLQIGYFDRSYDPLNHSYGYTVASEQSGGSLTFNFTQVSTALSNPTKGTRWFSGRTPNPAFPHPTTFLGDYSGITTFSGGVASLWTDLRNSVTFGRTGTGEDAFYAVNP